MEYELIMLDLKTERELKRMGVSWFVSYSYYKKIDSSHRNWEKNDTNDTIRIPAYNRTVLNHKNFLLEILKKNNDMLSRNSLGLDGNDIKIMAQEILEKM